MNWKSLLLVLLFVPSGVAADRLTGKSFSTRSQVLAKHGMACTSHPLATQVAIDILQQGGSAVDAAIAANAMLGLVEPVSNGIGGDLFAIVWDAKTKKLFGLNASGRSPATLTRAEFAKRNLSSIPSKGVLPISVPGCVDGWAELHSRFGRLPMSEVLRPTIRYAREGTPVPETIAYYWAAGVRAFESQPGFAETFMLNGRAPREGDVFRNPGLANTLEAIGEHGRDAFYKGNIARTMAEFVQQCGGFLSEDDLANHTSDWVEPVSTNYRGYTVWELPPNGQGIAALQILNTLEGYDLRSFGFGSADHIHHFVEAKKLAFEDRAKYYADPDFNKIPVKELISKEYSAERRKLIDSKRAASTYAAGDITHGDTIYLTVADKDRNMVSLIQSNYAGFGSGVCPPGLGFSFQNRGQLFTLAEDHFNSYEPRKRPFHTIIPAFITKDDKPYISFGVMGGAMQPQGHAQIVMNLIDFDMNLQEAGDAPRIRHTKSSQPTGEQMSDGGLVHLEHGFSFETVRDLVGRGHQIQQSRGGFGGYQAIRFDAERDVYFGASESRKDGCAMGY